MYIKFVVDHILLESFMLIPLLIGCATVVVTMVIQVAAIVQMLQYLLNVVRRTVAGPVSPGKATYVIFMIMTMLFIGHIAQAAVWAFLFMLLGEFGDFATAFYHSLVNLASLGYGDIVMSEQWRLLGAFEASAGVLLFGLSAGTILSIMSFILSHDSRFKTRLAELRDQAFKED